MDTDVLAVMELYNSIINLFKTTQDNFNNFQAKAIYLSKVQGYDKDMKRWKSMKLPFDKFRDDEVIMTGKEDFGITFLVIIGRLFRQLQKRLAAYEEFHKKCSF